MKPPLQLLIICTLIARVLQISRIVNLITPKIDYSTSQMGYLTIKAKVLIEVNHNTDTLPNPTLRLLLPFITANDINLYYTPIDSQCDKIRSTNQAVSTTIAGDEAGAYVFEMSELSFAKSAKLYLFFRITGLPASVATMTVYTPVGLSLISTTTSPYFVTYAYTPTFTNLIQTPQGSSGTMTIDTSPSTAQTNYDVITKTFESLIDITVSKETKRLVLRFDSSSGYLWAIDAAQTCELINGGAGHRTLSGTEYECELEEEGEGGGGQYGLFVIFTTTSLSSGDKIRLKAKVNNPQLPGSGDLTIASMPRYSGEILEINSVTSAFTCTGTTFKTGYPILSYGPDLSTAESTFPNLGLFQSGTTTNRIIFNSIKLTFKPAIDIPEPTDYYKLVIKVGGGSTKTTLPHNLIYENFNRASGKSKIEITVDPTTYDITIINIGAMSELSSYSVGFKIALEGDESFAWGSTFLQMTLTDSTGAVIIAGTVPQNVNTAAQTIITNPVPSSFGIPTVLHSLPSTAADTDFTSISATNYGIKKDTLQYFFLSGNIQRTGSFVNGQNWIEMIMSKKVTVSNTVVFTTANADTNCFVRNNAGAVLTGTIQNCHYEIQNKGQTNREYTRLRIGGKTNDFWSNGNNYYWGFKRTNIEVQNSLYLNDADAVILDVYINIYADAGTDDPTIAFTNAATTQYMDNMIAINNDVMNQVVIDFPNYFRATGDQLDGEEVPVFLRLSGILDGVQTFETQKILLFFNDFELHYIDSDQYEVGCSNSDDLLVRCYHKRGLTNGQRACGGSTCSHMLYRDRLEIHFTSATLALASAEDIQVLIPIKLPTGSHQNFNLAIGVASTHSGAFNDFNELREFRILPTISYPSLATATTVSSLKNSATAINAASSIKPKVVSIDTAVKGKIGESFSAQIDMDCDSTSYPECKITASGEYYSITMCANWNFMSAGMTVSNLIEEYDVPDIYTECIQGLKYLYGSQMRYCLYCSIWQSGSTEDSRVMTNFKIPNYYNNKWPTGTYTALSGLNTKYGLVKLTNMNLISEIAFEPNSISSVSVSPTTWYKSYKSMSLQVSLKTTNNLYTGGTIIIRSNTILPMTFMKTPNDYCWITKDSTTTQCSAQISGLDIQITLASDLDAGELSIKLYNIEITDPGTDVQASFRIITTTSVGVTDDYFVDLSEAEAFVVAFEEHPSGLINQFQIDEVLYGSDDSSALSYFELSIILGNSKPIFQSDTFKVNLGEAATATSTAPVWCQLVNAKGEIITEITTCKADDLSDIQISSVDATTLNIFRMKLWSYIIPTSYTTVPTTDLTATLETDTGAGATTVTQTLYSLASQILPEINPTTAYPNLGTFTITPSLPFYGARTIWTLKVAPAAYSVTGSDVLILTFPPNTNSQLDDRIHSCVLDGTTQVELFCRMKENREMTISGFDSGISPGSPVTILIDGLEIGHGTMGYFYLRIVDKDDVLQESRSVGTVITPSALTTEYLRIYDLSFTSLFVRATTDLTYKFKTGTTAVSSGDVIHVWLEHFSYEYMILPLTLTCQVNVGGSDVSTKCTRIGKRIMIAVSGISSGTEVEVVIKELVTPNYKACNIMKILQYITNSATTSVKYISNSEFQDIEDMDTSLDSTLTYLNFEGLSSSEFITVNRGLYNALKVVREDGGRFNDEMNFTLTRDYGGQFHSLNPIEVQKRDSYLGETSIPMQFGCESNSLITVFLLKVEKTERFKEDRFAPLPFLVIETIPEKKSLPVLSSIQVFRGYESLPMILKLESLPIADVTINVSIESFDSLNALTLTKPTSSVLTMSRTNILEEIIVKSSHEISSDPISDTNSRIVFTPADDSPYQKTTVELELKDLVVDTSNTFSLEMVTISEHSCTVNLKIHMPLTIYYYIVPKVLYEKLSQAYVESQIKLGIFTDGYIHYGILNVESDLSDYNLCGDDLIADTEYIFRIHYKTFVVQDIAESSSSTTTSSSSESTWNPLKRPVLTDEVIDSSSSNSTIQRLDYGSIYKAFSTESSSTAAQAYLDVTFDSVPTDAQIKDLCCYFAQLVSYPLENLWTSDGVRCSSQQLADDNNYISATATSSRLLVEENEKNTNTLNKFLRAERILASNPVIRLNFLRNLRDSQDGVSISENSTAKKVLYATVQPDWEATYSSHPKITAISPLLSSTPSSPGFDSYANITVLEDKDGIRIKRIKLETTGYVYGIVVESTGDDMGEDGLASYMKIRKGENLVQTTSRRILEHFRTGNLEEAHPSNPVKMFQKKARLLSGGGGSTPVPGAVVGTFVKKFESINEEVDVEIKDLITDRAYEIFYWAGAGFGELLMKSTQIVRHTITINADYVATTSGSIYQIWAILGLGIFAWMSLTIQFYQIIQVWVNI